MLVAMAKDWREKYQKMYSRGLKLWEYVSEDVWRDTRRNFKVGFVKTCNLSVRSFMDSDLQTQACALTYRTVLAIVPALALALAISRGFGLSDQLTQQLYEHFPAQQESIKLAMQFVDGYLAQTSEGLFVGIGILFLLWTLISLLSSVEDSFNRIWQVRTGRTMWRKLTDYLAIFLILPILMICGSGLTLMMSTALNSLIFMDFMAPAVKIIIDVVSYVITWLFFAGAYMLIPNAKVKFVNALIAGIFVGTAFQVIQWLFVSGQMYVTKYNAIYGSFSFLPLLLIWLQLSWLVTLIGALLCFASQNIGQFNYYRDIIHISGNYRMKVTLVVLAIIVKRFVRRMPALTYKGIAETYHIPSGLVKDIILRLKESGIILMEESAGELLDHPLVPAVDVSQLTIESVISKLQNYGNSDFLPDFNEDYAAVDKLVDKMSNALSKSIGNTVVASINIQI